MRGGFSPGETRPLIQNCENRCKNVVIWCRNRPPKGYSLPLLNRPNRPETLTLKGVGNAKRKHEFLFAFILCASCRGD